MKGLFSNKSHLETLGSNVQATRRIILRVLYDLAKKHTSKIIMWTVMMMTEAPDFGNESIEKQQ